MSKCCSVSRKLRQWEEQGDSDYEAYSDKSGHLNLQSLYSNTQNDTLLREIEVSWN